MQLISQQDKRWANEKIGKTWLKIGRWGCTICSLCMLLSKVTVDYPNPDHAARTWSFTNQGLINWFKSDFAPFRFVKRYYYLDKRLLEIYANANNKGVILEVNRSHWVAVNRIEEGKIIINDPWLGDEVNVYSRYKKITGMALFEIPTV